MKIKRIVAWIIDWIFCGIPSLLYSYIFSAIVKAFGQTHPLTLIGGIIFFLFVISYFGLFIFRDVIFKGSSVAKRIFHLHVVDIDTNATPSISKLVIRNIFLFIYPVDAIVLIATGRSLGDMASNTITVNYIR